MKANSTPPLASPGAAKAPQTFFLANVTADWFIHETKTPCYTAGQTWNGWATPYFSWEQAQKLMALMPDLRYDAPTDCFVMTNLESPPGEDDEVFTPCTIEVAGEQVKVWAIGAWAWCWRLADVLVARQFEAPSFNVSRSLPR